MRNKKVEIICQCPFCGTISRVSVYAYQYALYLQGDLAQNVFPQLSATDREKIISGLCDKCQNDVFGEGEDYED